MIAIIFSVALSALAVDGTFQGKVVDPPEDAPHVEGWIFIQGHNNALRRVEITHAKIIYADEIPAQKRRKCDRDCVEPGQLVRVTAEQDSGGQWRAKEIEILRLTENPARTAVPRLLTTSINNSLPTCLRRIADNQGCRILHPTTSAKNPLN
jgi:hypothetical protein